VRWTPESAVEWASEYWPVRRNPRNRLLLRCCPIMYAKAFAGAAPVFSRVTYDTADAETGNTQPVHSEQQ
jgi:hypothetical protein